MVSFLPTCWVIKEACIHLFSYNTSFQSSPRSKWNQWNTMIITKFCHFTDLFLVFWPNNKISWMTLVMRFIFSMLFSYNHGRWHIFFSNYFLKCFLDAVINCWIGGLPEKIIFHLFKKIITHNKQMPDSWLKAYLCYTAACILTTVQVLLKVHEHLPYTLNFVII